MQTRWGPGSGRLPSGLQTLQTSAAKKNPQTWFQNVCTPEETWRGMSLAAACNQLQLASNLLADVPGKHVHGICAY